MLEALVRSVETVLEDFCQGRSFFWGDMLDEHTGAFAKRYAVGDGKKQVIVSVEHVGGHGMMIVKVMKRNPNHFIFIYENGEVDSNMIEDKAMSLIRQTSGTPEKFREVLRFFLVR